MKCTISWFALHNSLASSYPNSLCKFFASGAIFSVLRRISCAVSRKKWSLNRSTLAAMRWSGVILSDLKGVSLTLLTLWHLTLDELLFAIHSAFSSLFYQAYNHFSCPNQLQLLASFFLCILRKYPPTTTLISPSDRGFKSDTISRHSLPNLHRCRLGNKSWKSTSTEGAILSEFLEFSESSESWLLTNSFWIAENSVMRGCAAKNRNCAIFRSSDA